MMDVDNDLRIREKFSDLASDYGDTPPAALYIAVAEFFDLEDDGRRSLACYAKAASLAQDNAHVRFLYARALLKAKRYRDGGKELEACSDIDSVELASPVYHENNLYYISYALFQIGSYKEAAEGFRGAQNLINIWIDPFVLKRFHLHQGFCWHLERNFQEAGECYHRALIAPGPGDSCDEDPMDEALVEKAQDLNEEIEPFYLMAQRCDPLELETISGVVPSFP